MADKEKVRSGRPMPWVRHKFVAVPEELRGTIDPNEATELNALCGYCKTLTKELDFVQDNSQTLLGNGSEKTIFESQLTQNDILGANLLENARSGCHICTLVFNAVGSTDIYTSLYHWKWVHSMSSNHGQLNMVLKTRLSTEAHNIGDQHPMNDEVIVKLRTTIANVVQSLTGSLPSVFTMSDKTINLARTWSHQCLVEHPKCPNYEPKWMPTRLVEIVSAESVRIVDTKGLSSPVSYYALSYCWGTSPVLTTTRAKLAGFKMNISFETLPLTIRDTITVVNRLGGRYLWIDSICIVQDDMEDWEREAQTMCDVYQNAYITIVALGATGATEGLFGRRDPLAGRNCILPNKNNISRIVTAPEVLDRSFGAFSASTLQTRGWTFQERALAPRKLLFASYIFWECTSTFEEEIPNHAWQRTNLFNRRFLPLPQVMRVDFEPNHLGYYTVPDFLMHWYEDLQDFSGRNLTKPTDRLVAISGVIKYIERNVSMKSYYGMWMDIIVIDLLWKHSGWSERLQRLIDVPTWSWASLMGRVAPAFDVKRPFVPVKGVKIQQNDEDAKILVLEGRILQTMLTEASHPLRILSERERKLRALIGAGRERKVRALMGDDSDAIDGNGHWSVSGMKGIIDCSPTLDFASQDHESLAKDTNQQDMKLQVRSFVMIPLIVQASKFFSKDTPLVQCYGLLIKPSSMRDECYERVGVLELTLDMSTRRRDKFRKWRGVIEEPNWPQDSWKTVGIV